jgi:integrase
MASKFSKLTRPNVKKLIPGQKVLEHGIEFERLTNGDGRYSVNIMVDGQRIHRVIGKESEGVTREQAEQFIEKTRTEAREGRLKLPKGRKLHLTFAEAAEEYIRRLEAGDGKEINAKKQRLRDYLVPFFGDKVISQISTFDVDRYKKARQDDKQEIKKKVKKPDGSSEVVIEYRPYQTGTINRELQTFSHFLTKAVEWGWAEYKPCKITKLKENPGRIVYLTKEQVQRLVEEAQKDDCPAIYPFILIGLATGMRRSEILSIRIENIDPARRCIYVPEAKAGARTQPIPAHLADYLRESIKNKTKEGWLFPAEKSKSGHTQWIEKPFRRVVTKAGLDPKQVVRHTLRHTAISHLVQAGIDLPTVKRISGHKTLQMVERYSHQDGNHIQAALEKLEDRYGLPQAR